jgi:uncharacterized coiled-coil protein SlyX
MSPSGRFAGFRGKITPRSLERFESADAGGTVDSAQGSAEEARTVDERDQASSAGGHELATEVGERVRTIIAAAEAAANALRHEAEQTAAVRRRIAEEEAARIIEDAKADADAYLAERIRRIAELSDTVVERAETIVSRLDRAEDVRRQLQALADALGESAERLASEVRIGTPPPTVRSPSSSPPATGAPPAPAPPSETAAEQPMGSGSMPAPAAPSFEVEPAAPEAPPAGGAIPAPEAPAPVTEGRAPEEAVAAPPPPEPEPEPATVTEPDAAAQDVVRLDRREPPEADTAVTPERPDADQQLGARLVALQMAVAGGARGEVETHLLRTFDLIDCTSILDDIFGPGTDADKRVAWPRPADGAA